MRYVAVLLFSLIFLPFGVCATTSDELLTPVELGCGSSACQLFNGLAPYKLMTYDGNWSKQIVMPSAHQGLVLDMESGATYASLIVSEQGDRPAIYLSFAFGDYKINTDIRMHTGDHYIFDIARTRGGYAWRPIGNSVRYMQAARDGAYMPNAPRLLVYQTTNGSWYSDIYLPDQPGDDQMVIVNSDASYSSQIHGSSKGPAIAGISKGQTIVFKYVNNKWTTIDWSPY